MQEGKIYEDIALRTEGDIYIGVVGPVRTGKSTFIKRFMETLVIPNIENVYRRERARDELPQSGSGRTIMTAEPKFVPEEAASVTVEGGVSFRVRLIDCVGYMVTGAVGQMEGELERMVTTPWFDHEIPMAEAAEVGTRKVISEQMCIRDRERGAAHPGPAGGSYPEGDHRRLSPDAAPGGDEAGAGGALSLIHISGRGQPPWAGECWPGPRWRSLCC